MPQDFSLMSIGKQSLSFSFETPTYHAGDIVQYEIQCNKTGVMKATVGYASIDETEIHVTSLLSNTSYNCRVNSDIDCLVL